MSRTFIDADLLTWEAYATSGHYGYAEPARIVFHCLTDPSVRARTVGVDDEAAAERIVADADLAELRSLFQHSEPLD